MKKTSLALGLAAALLLAACDNVNVSTSGSSADISEESSSSVVTDPSSGSSEESSGVSEPGSESESSETEPGSSDVSSEEGSSEESSSEDSSSEPEPEPEPTYVDISYLNLISSGFETPYLIDAQGNALETTSLEAGSEATVRIEFASYYAAYVPGLYVHVNGQGYHVDASTATDSHIDFTFTVPEEDTEIAIITNDGYDPDGEGVAITMDLDDDLVVYGWIAGDTFDSSFSPVFKRPDAAWTLDSYSFTNTDTGAEVSYQGYLSVPSWRSDNPLLSYGWYLQPSYFNPSGPVTISATGSIKAVYNIEYVNAENVIDDYGNPAEFTTSAMEGEYVYASYLHSSVPGEYISSITVSTDSGVDPSDWRANFPPNASLSQGGSFNFTMPAEDVTITFGFGEGLTPTVSAGSQYLSGHGFYSNTYAYEYSTPVTTCLPGSTIYLWCDAAPGYTLTGAIVNGDAEHPVSPVNAGSYYIHRYYFPIAIPENAESVSVEVTAGTAYTVSLGTYDADAGVSLNLPDGSNFSEGADVRFGVNCGNLYNVTGVTSEQVEITHDGSWYTFTMPAENVVIDVLTEAKPTHAAEIVVNLPEGVDEESAAITAWEFYNYASGIDVTDNDENAPATLSGIWGNLLEGSYTTLYLTPAEGYLFSVSYVTAANPEPTSVEGSYNSWSNNYYYSGIQTVEGLVITIDVETTTAATFNYVYEDGLTEADIAFTFEYNHNGAETLDGVVFYNDTFNIEIAAADGYEVPAGKTLTISITGDVTKYSYNDFYTVNANAAEITVTIALADSYTATIDNQVTDATVYWYFYINGTSHGYYGNETSFAVLSTDDCYISAYASGNGGYLSIDITVTGDSTGIVFYSGTHTGYMDANSTHFTCTENVTITIAPTPAEA